MGVRFDTATGLYRLTNAPATAVPLTMSFWFKVAASAGDAPWVSLSNITTGSNRFMMFGMGEGGPFEGNVVVHR